MYDCSQRRIRPLAGVGARQLEKVEGTGSASGSLPFYRLAGTLRASTTPKAHVGL